MIFNKEGLLRAMKKYFKYIGILELICVSIIVLVYLCSIISAMPEIFDEPYLLFKSTAILILLSVIGPAVGLLFISHSNSLPEKANLEKPVIETHRDYKIRYKKGDEKFEIGDFVDCIDEEMIKQYKIKKHGIITTLNDNGIYVKFEGENGHYTLYVSCYQIRKSKTES